MRLMPLALCTYDEGHVYAETCVLCVPLLRAVLSPPSDGAPDMRTVLPSLFSAADAAAVTSVRGVLDLVFCSAIGLRPLRHPTLPQVCGCEPGVLLRPLDTPPQCTLRRRPML